MKNLTCSVQAQDLLLYNVYGTSLTPQWGTRKPLRTIYPFFPLSPVGEEPLKASPAPLISDHTMNLINGCPASFFKIVSLATSSSLT